MVQSQMFRVNSPHVVCETIDGEVVIVNLDKGYYYSLLKTGAEVWNHIEGRVERLNMIQEMSQKYDASNEEIAAAIDEFLASLLDEELIVLDGELISNQINENKNEISLLAQRIPFEKPILEKFTDMEDLLLLDPIHEVDVEAGWPNTKTT